MHTQLIRLLRRHGDLGVTAQRLSFSAAAASRARLGATGSAARRAGGRAFAARLVALDRTAATAGSEKQGKGNCDCDVNFRCHHDAYSLNAS
jgi:hypothetical protein